MLQYAVDIT